MNTQGRSQQCWIPTTTSSKEEAPSWVQVVMLVGQGPALANSIFMLLCSHLSQHTIHCSKFSCLFYTYFQAFFFFLKVPKNLWVTPWLLLKPADNPFEQTLFFLVSALALPRWGQTSSEAVLDTLFMHAVHSCIPRCGYPGRVTKRRSYTDFLVSATYRQPYMLKLFLLDIGQHEINELKFDSWVQPDCSNVYG